MTKLYLIKWGYYSNFEEPAINSIWTTIEGARAKIFDIVEAKELKPKVLKNGKLLTDSYHDGDYYTYIEEVTADNEDLYAE